jgi:hypothetical protein
MRDDIHDHCSASSNLAQNADISPTRCCGDIAEIIPVIASLGAQAKDDPSMIRLAPCKPQPHGVTMQKAFSTQE